MQVNDAPAATTVSPEVKLAAASVTITGDPGKTYDGMPVTTGYTTNNTAGAVLVEYKEQGRRNRDSNPVAFWIVILCMAGIVVTGSLVYNRKRKQNR